MATPLPPATVFVVDDEENMRNALTRLLRLAGYAAEAYGSAQAFFDTYRRERPGCLLLDVKMPGMSGPELQQALAAQGIGLPVVFLTGYGTVPLAVDAMKAGAVDFLEKPFDTEALLARVAQALAMDAQRRAATQAQEVRQQRLASLTPREREVMDGVAAGRSNKEIARELGMSDRTVEVHRARVMEKLEVASVAELVRLLLSDEPQEKPPGT